MAEAAPDEAPPLPPRLRLFFALWPDEALRRPLARWVRLAHTRCGGRATRPETLHLTLAFLGEVARERLPELAAAAARVSGVALDFPVDRLGAWTHNQLVWAGCNTPDPALMALAQGLQQELATAGFTLPERAFVPHVTLLRRADTSRPLPAPRPLRWQADDFVLVRSLPEGGYRVMGRWPLRGAAGGTGEAPGATAV